MKTSKIIKILALLICLTAITQPASAVNVSKYLSGDAINWNGRVIDIAALKKYYKSRRGKGIWTSKTGLNKHGVVLLKVLSRAGDDGLVAKDYLSGFPARAQDLRGDNLVASELFLSQAF